MSNTPKVVFQMIVYNSDYLLEPVLESLEPYGPVVVTEGPVGYWQNHEQTPDRTLDILRAHVPEKNIVRGTWSEKDEMMNAVLDRIPPDTDYVWMVDSDEVWAPETIEELFSILAFEKPDSVSFKANSFFAGLDRIITGFEEDFEVVRIQRWYPGASWHTHRPPTVLSPNGVPFRNMKALSHEQTSARGLRFLHYSYFFPVQTRDKTRYYESIFPSNAIPDYFNKIWMPWATGDSRTREQIEAQWNGVHNFHPEQRGPTFTKPFCGHHPQVIARRRTDIMRRWEQEMTWCFVARPEPQVNFDGWGIAHECWTWIRDNVQVGSSVVELGAGKVSTPLLASRFRTTSIEENPEYINCFSGVRYVHAPIENGWYKPECLTDLPREYAMLLIDGPKGDNDRLVILKHMNLFGNPATIIVDDTHREDGQAIVAGLQALGWQVFHRGQKFNCLRKP